jgi:hypothetical protein
VQRRPPCRDGQPARDGQVTDAQGLGRDRLLAQPDPPGPAGQVVRDADQRQPGGVGGESTRGQMLKAQAVLEVADGGFNRPFTLPL